MPRNIITPKGERIIETGAIYTPDEGGFLVEHSISDLEGYTRQTTPIVIPEDEMTIAFKEYILDKIAEKYV